MLSDSLHGEARRRRLWATVAAGLVLVTWNNLVHLVVDAYVPLNLALAAVLVLAGRVAGLDRSGLGLTPGRAGRAALTGAAVAAVAAAVLAVGVVVPALRPLLEDQRFAGRDAASTLWHAFGRVPLGTVLLEEVAFRGVLLGLLVPLLGGVRAVTVSSLLFGLWHIRPGWGMLAANGAEVGVLSVAGVVATVAVTALAGAAFCWLRLRTGHLAAPAVAHAGINAFGTLAAYVALRADE